MTTNNIKYSMNELEEIIQDAMRNEDITLNFYGLNNIIYELYEVQQASNDVNRVLSQLDYRIDCIKAGDNINYLEV